MTINLIQIAQALNLTQAQTTLLIIAQVWSLAWKGVAWWKSARKGHIIWFVVFIITNTLGILEILYIFLFSKIKLEPRKVKKKRR